MPELELIRGTNSFDTFDNLKALLDTLPNLIAATNTDSANLKPILLEAWYDIGALAVDFGNDITTTRYFSTSVLDALSTNEQNLLNHALITEAEFILSTSNAHRDANIRRLTVGESTTVFRNNRAIIVCPEAVRILQPYIVPAQNHVAMIHV